MEDLSEVLKRLATRTTSEGSPEYYAPDPEEAAAPCPRCGGRGWYTPDVPVGHPEFGTIVTCECQHDRLERERSGRLLRYSNLGYLTRYTFESLNPEGRTADPEARRLFQAAVRIAVDYAEKPSGWLVLRGPHSSGKTHLAAAIGNRRVELGEVVFFVQVSDLLDHLRSSFGPDSDTSYSELFDQVRNIPLLVLDGLGIHSTTPWAEEKLRQVVGHRFNARLPTVVTTASEMAQLDPYVAGRLQDPDESRVLELRGAAPERAPRLGRVEPAMLTRMTFDTFDVRGNNPSAAQRASLEAALLAARNFADDPDGWLTLYGDTGVGKTHLAVAIATEHIARGEIVFFAFVPRALGLPPVHLQSRELGHLRPSVRAGQDFAAAHPRRPWQRAEQRVGPREALPDRRAQTQRPAAHHYHHHGRLHQGARPNRLPGPGPLDRAAHQHGRARLPQQRAPSSSQPPSRFSTPDPPLTAGRAAETTPVSNWSAAAPCRLGVRIYRTSLKHWDLIV